jgi:hypothetical protein
MNGFVAAVSLVFGVLAWLQLPAVCGFMLSSTLAGAGNYLYSLWLGVMIALIGLASGGRALLRAGKHPLLLIGVVLNAAFLLWAVLSYGSYGRACIAIYFYFTPS